MKSFVAAAAFAGLASAFTAPTNATFGALYLPDTTHPVTTGQNFQITWQAPQPADGSTVSLVLCRGPSANCVIQTPAIVEGVSSSAASYNWNVPCSLPVGTQGTDTGAGILIIVDGTGVFQYSTQFSILQGSSCSSSSSSTTTTTSATTSSKSSSSSSSSTSSSSSSMSSSSSGGWAGWPSTTISTSVVLTTVTPTTKITPVPVTTAAASTTYSMASSSSPSPKPFTGAAAVPTAFANAAGFVGAAVLGMMAL